MILGGVEIPWEKGLLGHSDADVLLHALMDAILGAAALGDIGQHFPDSDERYAGADSLRLLAEVARLLNEAGYRLVNADCTILAQRPKLMPHIPQMRANIARALEADVDAILQEVPRIVAYLRGFSPIWQDLESGRRQHLL